jgi:hypothetical protein
VSENNTNEGLKGIEEYVKEYKDTNIIVTGIPHMHDLSPTSCVNLDVQKFNRKLKKLMKLCSSFRLYNCTGCVDGVVNAIEVGYLPLSRHLLAQTEEAKKRQQAAAFVPTIECRTFGKGRRENHWTGTITSVLFVETLKKIVIQSIHPFLRPHVCTLPTLHTLTVVLAATSNAINVLCFANHNDHVATPGRRQGGEECLGGWGEQTQGLPLTNTHHGPKQKQVTNV